MQQVATAHSTTTDSAIHRYHVPSSHIGPRNDYSKYLHAIKYQSDHESFEESKNRVAESLTEDNPEFYHRFRRLLLTQSFLVGGRIAANLGKSRKCTALNCFVTPVIDDTFCIVGENGHNGIMGVANKLAQTLRTGGGVGHDWSTLRPRGDNIVSLEAKASGPVSFMGIYDAICQASASAGHRRGAQLASLRVDHPDIEEFVQAKHDQHTLTSMNISVAVTDEFMQALERDDDFPLKFNGRVYKYVSARLLWEKIMRSTWDWAEPGVLFVDTINKKNNLRSIENIRTTNPCGEIPLPPNGSCLLGSFNLVKYLREDGDSLRFDYESFKSDIPIVLRALDNVIDKTLYPLEEQEKEMKSKRRIGIGVTGLANAIETMGHPYGSQPFLEVLRKIMGTLRDTLYRTSIDLAKEKGPFPLFKADDFCLSEFVCKLPTDIQEGIREHGIRNSHLLAIAPTGTISLTADNVSSSIEPVFAKNVERTYQTEEGAKTTVLDDYAWSRWGTVPKTADEVSAEEHLKVLAYTQEFVDQACSKTVNMDSTMQWEDFKSLYLRAWRLGCKGLSTFNKDGKRMGILKSKDDGKDKEDAKAKACILDPETGIKTCDS